MRIRRPSPALVVACVALVVALSGTAFGDEVAHVAARITGKDIPRGTITARHIRKASITGDRIKPRTLTAGLFRAGQLPAGARGLTGATGAAGAAGATGPQGAKGDPGTSVFASTIPSGTTVRGVWGATVGDGDATTAKTTADFVSFPVRAPVALTDADVGFQSEPTNATVDALPGCTGDEENATAPPGKVCIYLIASIGPGIGYTLSGDALNPFGASGSRTGFKVTITKPAVGTAGAWGVWAYTAP